MALIFSVNLTFILIFLIQMSFQSFNIHSNDMLYAYTRIRVMIQLETKIPVQLLLPQSLCVYKAIDVVFSTKIELFKRNKKEPKMREYRIFKTRKECHH